MLNWIISTVSALGRWRGRGRGLKWGFFCCHFPFIVSSTVLFCWQRLKTIFFEALVFLPCSYFRNGITLSCAYIDCHPPLPLFRVITFLLLFFTQLHNYSNFHVYFDLFVHGFRLPSLSVSLSFTSACGCLEYSHNHA